MCGLTGLLHRGGDAGSLDAIAAMTARLKHRGPDAQAVWMDREAGIALGHTRLSIIDLSPMGAQPMHSASGRLVLALNGEIYNYAELREALAAEAAAPAWRGHSDTEVMLAAFEHWGVEKTLQRCDGMFAVALWDRAARSLTLARDRLGEKPLYYGWQQETLVFGSELKALAALPGFAPELDEAALGAFLRYGYVPAPLSIFRSIRKLLPGHFLRLGAEAQAGQLAAPQAYWSLHDAACEGLNDRWSGSDEEAVDELERLLRRSVASRSVADVPLGAFLSGGVDSSTIVALMQAQSSRPVHTYSIGFESAEHNEADQARAVAQHLRTAHTELVLKPEDALAVIPGLPELYDEPFADSSQIPTYLVSRLARKSVTVALSGDAGDELFGGYNRHVWVGSLWRRASRVPAPARRLASGILRAAPPAAWDALAARLAPVLPARLKLRLPGDKMHKLGMVLDSGSVDAVYANLIRLGPEELLREPAAIDSGWGLAQPMPEPAPDVAERLMFRDTLSYLPDDILVKVDRASMGVSLEARVPFLAREVVEFSWRLPPQMKVREGQGKWLLRQVLYRHVPRALVDRPKMGFAIPLAQWLRGPLRAWAEDLLGDPHPALDAAAVRRLWTAQLAGRGNHQAQLWGVLMFEAWRRRGLGA